MGKESGLGGEPFSIRFASASHERAENPHEDKNMKCRDASLLAVGTALTLAGNPARPSENLARVPDIDAARHAAGLISRADRAIRRYLDACHSNRDALEVVTSDARIEYTLDSPGALLSLDASSIFASCGSIGIPGAQPVNLWIFPTGEENAVFVQYDIPSSGPVSNGGAAERQVALVEMRGERIQRMRNFGAVPELLLATMNGKAQSELCARLSWNGERLATNAVTSVVLPLHSPDSVSVSSP
jgi:hypothetical protein